MTELEEMFHSFKLEYGLEYCTVCMRPTSMEDTIGFPWCEEHAHHGQVLSWGHRHGYPELHFDRRGLGPGEYAWWFAVRGTTQNSSDKGNEELMWAALIYLEYLDSVQQEKGIA